MSILLFNSATRRWTPRSLPGLLLWLASDYGLYNLQYAAVFDGINQSLSLADNASLSTGDVVHWSSAWFEPDDLNNAAGGGFPSIVGKSSSATANQEHEIRLTSSSGGATYLTGGAALRQIGFSNAAVVGSKSFVMGYHDSANDQIGISAGGAAFATGSTSGTAPPDSTMAYRIAARGPTPDRFFKGAVCRVAFGKTPSSSMATIRDLLYNSGNGLPYGDLTTQQKTDIGLISYWMLDEVSGTRNDSHGTNHLTSNNGVTQRLWRSVPIADSVKLSNVTDRSPVRNHGLQTNTSNQPIYKTNIFGTKPSIQLNGTNAFLRITDIVLTGDCTIAMALKVLSTPGTYLGHSTGTGKIVQTDATTLTITNDAGSSLVITHSALNNSVHEQTLVRDEGNWIRKVDGLEDGLGTLAGTITLNQIGLTGSATNFLSADIAEIICYGRAYT